MVVADVLARVAQIRGAKSDPEKAHSLEDDLYRDLLIAIAGKTCEDPAKCAYEALKTDEISFPRWCA